MALAHALLHSTNISSLCSSAWLSGGVTVGGCVVNKEWFYGGWVVYFGWGSESTDSRTSSVISQLCDLGHIILFHCLYCLWSQRVVVERTPELSPSIFILWFNSKNVTIQSERFLYSKNWAAGWERQKEDVNSLVGTRDDILAHRCPYACKWVVGQEGELLSLSAKPWGTFVGRQFSWTQSKNFCSLISPLTHSLAFIIKSKFWGSHSCIISMRHPSPLKSLLHFEHFAVSQFWSNTHVRWKDNRMLTN